jgi:hypothetical protein
MKYFQLFRITGVANSTTYDDGLKSTAAEPKRLIACHVQMNDWAATDDNEVQGYHERAKVFDFPHHMFNRVPKDVEPAVQRLELMSFAPVNLDIPEGEAFKVALKCAATAVDARGVYEYEIIS